MSNKKTALMLAMAAFTMAAESPYYTRHRHIDYDAQPQDRCKDCYKWGKCPTRNPEMKPCSAFKHKIGR